MLTQETKRLIITSVDTLLDKVADAVYIGLCEDMSPNDPEFNSTYEALLDEAQDMILNTLGE